MQKIRPDMDIGQNIQALRYQSKLTQDEVIVLSGKFYLSKFLISNQIKKGSSISLSGALHSRLSYPVPLWYHISDTTKQLRQEPPRPKFGFLP